MSVSPFPGGRARDRFVGFGLILVVVGWVGLVADVLLADALLQGGSLVAVLAVKADIATLAEMVIVSGLGLAILGGLREGFGALNRFFDAVLQRSGVSRSSAVPEGAPPSREEPIITVPNGLDRVHVEHPAQTAHRNYSLRPDGSVEVETLLGTRIFASMEEARDFIR